MNATTAVADERTFKMNTPRPRPLIARGLSRFNRICQSSQRGERRIERSGNGRRKIAADTVRCQKLFDWRQGIGRGFHYVVTCATMNVDINEARRQDAVAKIDRAAVLGNLSSCLRRQFHHDSIFHQKQWLFDAFEGSEQSCGGERNHESLGCRRSIIL